MKPLSQKLVYFSPTQTTRKILSAVADGTGIGLTEQFDLTPPDANGESIRDIYGELAIIGAPVYSGRVAPEAAIRLGRVHGKQTPAVVVVVYGNREYEDALLELKDIAEDNGFIPVVAAAFIGEHSFSSDVRPIAHGRPDKADLQAARSFGTAVRKKLETLPVPVPETPVVVPGNTPYRQGGTRKGISPDSNSSLCTLCGTCAAVCPMGVITVSNSVTTDKEGCILCCACVKNCSTGARVLQSPETENAANRLHDNCGARKEPETFI